MARAYLGAFCNHGYRFGVAEYVLGTLGYGAVVEIGDGSTLGSGLVVGIGGGPTLRNGFEELVGSNNASISCRVLMN